MSRPIAPGIALVLALSGPLGGCAGGGQPPAPAPRASGKPAIARPGASLVELEGRVLATATLISDKGGAILSNNGAGIVSNNGGALTAKVKLALAQAAEPWQLVEKAEVELVDAADRPAPGVAPVRTDGTGRYRLQAPPGTWLVRVKANGVRLSAFVRIGAAATKADVSPATTVVAEYVREQAKASQAALESVAEASVAALVARVEPVLRSGAVALELASPAAAVKVLERAAAAEPLVKTQAAAVAAELGVALAGAGARPSTAPTSVPGEPSPKPASTPTPGATPTPDPLLGTIIAGQAQLDPKPASAADAADAVGVDLGVPDSLAVAADGTVFFTSPAGTLRAITPAGAYVAAPLAAPIGSRLATLNGDALFVDAARTGIVAVASGAGPLQVRRLVAVKGAPLPAGAPLAAAGDGTFLVGHTRIGVDGVQADLLATSASLAGKAEPQAGTLPSALAYGVGGRLFAGYGAKDASGNVYEVLSGGQILATYGSSTTWTLATDRAGRLVMSQGGRVSRRDGPGASVELARGLACGAIAFAPDGTLYYVDVGAIRRLKP